MGSKKTQQQMTVAGPDCVQAPFWQKRQMYLMSTLLIVYAILIAAGCCIAFLKEKPTSRLLNAVAVEIGSPISDELFQLLRDDFNLTPLLGEGSLQRPSSILSFNTTEGHLAKLKDILKKENATFTFSHL